MASNDPSGIARALEDIEALKKELRDQRAEFQAELKIVKLALENISEFLKGTASKDDIEQLREGIIAASEMVRRNIADVVSAAAETASGRRAR